MWHQFYDLCTAEAHAHCTKHPSTTSSSSKKGGGGGGIGGGEEGIKCPRFDFGRYLMNAAQMYGAVPRIKLQEEEEEEREEMERENMEGRVRAVLMTDWEFGCTWFHGT